MYVTYMIISITNAICYGYNHVNHVREHLQQGYTQDQLDLSLLMANDFDIVELLLDYGANPNRQDGDGKTVLSHEHYPDVMKLLLDNGANPNIKDNRGKTSLFYVITTDIMELLLQHGADPNIQDKNVKTAIDYAIKYNNIEKIHLLSIYGAR